MGAIAFLPAKTTILRVDGCFPTLLFCRQRKRKALQRRYQELVIEIGRKASTRQGPHWYLLGGPVGECLGEDSGQTPVHSLTWYNASRAGHAARGRSCKTAGGHMSSPLEAHSLLGKNGIVEEAALLRFTPWFLRGFGLGWARACRALEGLHGLSC